jgi:hypothetical protein
MEITKTYYKIDGITLVRDNVIIDDNGKPFKTKSLASKYCVKNEMRNMTLGIYHNGYCLKYK